MVITVAWNIQTAIHLNGFSCEVYTDFDWDFEGSTVTYIIFLHSRYENERPYGSQNVHHTPATRQSIISHTEVARRRENPNRLVTYQNDQETNGAHVQSLLYMRMTARDTFHRWSNKAIPDRAASISLKFTPHTFCKWKREEFKSDCTKGSSHKMNWNQQ